MAHRHDESGSSDEEAPETIFLSQSKQSVHRHETELKKTEILVKERKREENRKRDRKLKELSSRKRKRNNQPPKDLILGSRAIRVLPDGNKPSTPSARPSRKIRKFLDRTLALKGGNPKARGWERRPVNIGIMRRNDGPAANFLRG
ncbi:hypothetical protein K443DRAFT_686390 [Laccaria amethystina LaAM-08-1]|uniref:Uncharacterized protein n=1 Tax=Laccaria amethystina LaAM-08-1 TaxID=1095629 RepID=A0A0C9X050_9AGAR|nr:hypothetical protein K443DRAFT_686390 [Laccaria amethystina LaAM-08-1]